jgi:predicted O-methyltransferase YrrM
VNPVKALKEKIKDWLGVTSLLAQRDELLSGYKYVPPGHFFSPIVSVEEYLRDEAANTGRPPSALLGVELNADAQLSLMAQLAAMWSPTLFPKAAAAGQRYYFPNPSFGASDAFFLHAMIRHFKPKRLIEVGSGFSSCVILDTNQHHFDNQIALTFIEPYPELLHSLVSLQDLSKHTVLSTRLQDIPFETFTALERDDILFIDSTHVSKTNSDVNYLFFEILPRLRPGVVVHIHDIFNGFEYPKDWIVEGRSWNEAYLLRAFLQYNPNVEILLFNNYLLVEHWDKFNELMPELAPHGGGSIWLRVK